MNPRRWNPHNPHHSPGYFFHTLFVDNLPDDVGVRWFRNLFSKFGKVRRAFIPRKRSKRSGHKFGFISFHSKHEADHAIARTNSLWIDGRNLIVKEAGFNIPQSQAHKFSGDYVGNKSFSSFDSQMKTNSYAEAVMNNQVKEQNTATFKVQPLASEWLSRSAIVKLKGPTPEMDFEIL